MGILRSVTRWACLYSASVVGGSVEVPIIQASCPKVASTSVSEVYSEDKIRWHPCSTHSAQCLARWKRPIKWRTATTTINILRLKFYFFKTLGFESSGYPPWNPAQHLRTDFRVFRTPVVPGISPAGSSAWAAIVREQTMKKSLSHFKLILDWRKCCKNSTVSVTILSNQTTIVRTGT